MADLFLSYSRQDSERARSLVLALERAGHSVWSDQQIKGGGQFSKKIEQALECADAVIVLWSANSVESAWVRDEAAAGRDSGRLIPVSIDGTKAPLGFREYQTIALAGGKIRGDSTSVRAILEAVAELTDSPPLQPAGGGAASGSARQGQFITRRRVAAGLVAAAAAGGAVFFLHGDRTASASPEVEAIFAQAWQAWTQGTSEGHSQAIGLFRRATAMAPENADAWGLLGCAYADHSHYFAPAMERPSLRARAREAGGRALELDSRNAYGRAAVAYARPIRGNWLLMEREFRRAVADQPEKWLISYSLALHLGRVGRMAESADLFNGLRDNAPTANQYLFHVQALWSAGDVDKAERVLDEARSIYSTHVAIWQARYDILLDSGRADAAFALTQDAQGKPSALSAGDLAVRAAVARAVAGGNAADVQSVRSSIVDLSRDSVQSAARMLQFASVLGLLDDAFSIAGALYFSRGFAVPDDKPIAGRASAATLDARDTRILFLPLTRKMRADARFEPLVNDIGLARYWREAGVQPDYRNA
jgi:tetratricopeptide (TPR) repeat protein